MKTAIYHIFSVICLAAASAVASAFTHVRAAIAFCWNWFADDHPIELKPKPKCKAALVQPNAYMASQAKRERPTVQARWRMCPST